MIVVCKQGWQKKNVDGNERKKEISITHLVDRCITGTAHKHSNLLLSIPCGVGGARGWSSGGGVAQGCSGYDLGTKNERRHTMKISKKVGIDQRNRQTVR